MRLALALASLVLATAASGQQGGRTPQPIVERAAKGSQCVADPAFMRRNHMDLLKHQRDDSVRSGVRSGQFSLKACIECHASRETGSVAKAETNFCVSCHSYAAVTIDCFECHTPKLQAQRAAARTVESASLRVAGKPQPQPAGAAK